MQRRAGHALACSLALVTLITLTAWNPPAGATAQPPVKNDKPGKPAWRWTLEERLAMRFDPEAIKARAAKRVAEREAMLLRMPPQSEDDLFSTPEPRIADRDTIEGWKTPELFLPTELFDHLLDMGFPPAGTFQEEGRQVIETRAVALGFGHDLWIRLERAAAPYLKLQAEHRRLAIARASTPSVKERPENDLSLPLCRARADAFAAAKAELGEESFLRLLYLGVTPSFSTSYSVEEGLAEKMLYVERGCR